MLEAGDQIDIWVVERALGSGGMGSVYRCHNRTAVRILAAVKVLEGNLRKYKEAEARFIREAEILFQLDHPNIVKVRNIRTDMDPPYLEMEFVEGDSLEARLRRGAINYELAVRFIEQMTGAVAYLHSRGVRHRDIKPANLLVKKDGNIKLVDFGLAMEADTERITQQGMTFGTVSYAPPEWISPDTLDPSQWDIYALGVVCYEMLTGDLAFPVSGQGSARQQAMQVIVGKQGHAPMDPGEEFHNDVRQLVMDMSHSDPKKRIRTAAEAHRRAKLLSTRMKRESGVTLMPGGFEDEESPSIVVDAPHPGQRPSHNPSTWVTATGAPGRDGVPVLPADFGESNAPTRNQFKLAPEPESAAHAPTDVSAPKGRTGTYVAMASIGVILMACVAVVLLIVGLWTQIGPSGTARGLEVVVTGLPPGSPVSIMLGNQIPNSNNGFIYAFNSAPFGANELTWVQGERCNLTDCPGLDCPPWCFTKTMDIAVEEGTGTFTLTVDLTPPPKRRVRVTTAGLEKEWDLDFELGGTEGRVVSGGVVFDDMEPGQYDLTAVVGSCPPQALGCWPKGECPDGCGAYRDKLVVPWGSDEYSWPLDMTDPKPGKATIASPSPSPGGAAPSPSPSSGGRKAGAPVTNSQFSSWLSSHADWQHDAAIAAGRADKNYLQGWEGTTPKPGTAGGPATNVSWFAAAAYCKNRGGLASVEAQPHRWTESASQPYVEWRVEGGKAAWRGSDGRSSSKGISLKTGNGVTGFRCSK